MGTTFRPNSAGFRAMAVGAELRAGCLAKAHRAESIAMALAEDFTDSGEYLEAFEVTSDTVRLRTAFGEHDVAAGRLTNHSPHAAAVEWGNARDHRAHHVLDRTLGSLSHG